MGNTAVMRYLGKPLSIKQSKNFIKEFNAREGKLDFGWWAITIKEDERFIGLCGLGWTTIANSREVELAYLLSKSFWGQGLASEAALSCLRYGFEQLSLGRIFAITRFRNVAGYKVAEKVGMKLAGSERIANRQYLYYVITRADFNPGDSIYLLKT